MLKISVLSLALLTALTSCQLFSTSSSFNPERSPSNKSDMNWLVETNARYGSDSTLQHLLHLWQKKRDALEKKQSAKSQASIEQMQIISRYINFLNLAESEKEFVTQRLFESSTQFLFCDDLENWECLEKTPTLNPLVAYRRETSEDLGQPVRVNSPLHIKYFFSKQWYRSKKDLIESTEQSIPEKASLSSELAQILNEDWSRISAAIYGIDGLGELQKNTPNYSMQIVMNAIQRHNNIRAVVDVEAYKNTNTERREIKFQYPPTIELYDSLNRNQTEENLKVRLEWPTANIMHNKFFVFEKDNKKSVWTGTANISKNCMGDENFANMAVYIQNTEVAESYLSEFEEMFTYAPAGEIKAPMLVGKFHQNKRPNTKRYFIFNDDTELRVHFSPTDDGEHRAILPMLLSARSGDVIRVSMFGSAGTEYIRALQYAASQGAHVKVFVDRDTSFQISNSWINKKSVTRLQGKNPYPLTSGSLEIRHTNWGAGNMNHHKTASLTRKTSKGPQAQILIIGSQNWSLAGNDQNDENMLTIRNKTRGLPVAKAFGEHFDNFLWPTGQKVELE